MAEEFNYRCVGSTKSQFLKLLMGDKALSLSWSDCVHTKCSVLPSVNKRLVLTLCICMESLSPEQREIQKVCWITSQQGACRCTCPREIMASQERSAGEGLQWSSGSSPEQECLPLLLKAPSSLASKQLHSWSLNNISAQSNPPSTPLWEEFLPNV